MKLKRFFCYKYFCFLFFLIFAGGVGVAGAGKIKPTDSDVTIVWNGTAWSYENGNNVSWLDKNDSTVPGPNGSNDIIALNSTNYSITIRLEAYLAITSLFVFGEHPCTIDLNGYEFSVQNLFLGSSFDNSGDLDGGVIANDQDSLDNGITYEASKLGNLKIVNEGTGPKSIAITNFDTTTWRYSDDKLTQSLLDIGSNVSFNVNGSWDCGTTDGATGAAEGAKAIYISISDPNSVTVNGYVQDENSPIRQQIQQDIANGGSTPETPDVQPYIWYGTSSSDWDTPANWSTGEIPPEGENVTIETKDDGNGRNDPVLSSEISLNSIVFNTSSTLTIASGGSLKIDPNNLSGDYSILIESDGSFITSSADNFTIGNNFDSSSTGTIKTENSNCAITINTNFDGPINFDCVGNITLELNKDVKFGTVKANTFTNKGTATINTKLTSGTVTNNGTLTINGDIEATSVEILSGTLSIDGNKLASDNVNAILISESATLISMNSFTIGNNFDSNSKGTIKTENPDYEITINTSFVGPINFDCEGNLIINEEKDVVSGTVNAKNVTNNGSFTSENLKVEDTFVNSNTGTATVNTILTSGTVTNNGTLTINRQAEIKNFFNNSSTVIANNIIVIITKQFTNNGSFTGNLKLSGSEIVSDIKLAAEGNESVFKILEIDSDGKEVLFTGSPKIEKLKVVSAKSVNFYDNPNCIISEIEESNSNSTNYYFNKVKFANISDLGTSSDKIEFSTSGSIRFKECESSKNIKINNTNNEVYIESSFKGKDIECGKTTIDGTVTGEKIDFTETTINGSLEGTEITVGKTVLDGSIKGTVIKIGDASLTGTITGTEVSIETAELKGNIIGENITIEATEILGNSELKISESSTDGKIILNGDVSSTESKNLTLNGNVECNCLQINLNEGTLTAKGTFVAKKDLEITAKSTFEKTVNAEKSLSITGDSVFKSNVNVENNFTIVSIEQTFGGTIFVSNDFISKGKNITFSDKVSVNQNVEIQNTGLLKISNFEYGKSFVQSGSDTEIGQVMIFGDFIQTGESENPTATFASNVYFYSPTQNLSEIVIGSDKSTTTIAGNLIVAKAKENTISVKGSVKSNNFVLYSGNIELSGDIFTSGDVILLGENYSLKDNQTGIQNLYSYNENRPANWSQASYSFEKNIPDVTQENPNGTKLPDGTESNRFKGTLKVASGKSITVGKNFYANGIELSGNGKWNLFIPDNSNAENSFCEAYNSTVLACQVECSDENLRGKNVSKISALQCTDNGGNENWAFDDVKITKAYSVSDKVIRVEFNAPVRIQKKYNQQSQLRFSNSPDENHLFEAVYLNDDCSQEAVLQGDYYIVSQNYKNEENQTVYYCYFKANSTWNTDATGKSAGNSEKSTDYEANHKDTNICLDFPRAIQNGSAINSFVITDAWGTRLKNYSLRTTNGDTKIPYGHSDDLENAVEDKTGPVLISVKTGQENHTEYNSSKGAEGQASYDAHNFIEFLYSEPVNFGSENIDVCDVWLKSDEKVENIQVTQKLGALQNEDITQSGQLKIAGLAKIQNGKIYTGSQGNVDKYVNALYRFDEYSLRYSIAGFTDKTQTVKDREGFEHKKWIGYIEEAEIPSGYVSMITEGKNSLVSDLKGNAQTLVKKELVVDSVENGVYGKWDISSPMFAPFNNNTIQVNPLYVEAIGNNNGFGSTLDRIEFHLFDNTVKLDSSDEAVWLTEFGWCKNDGSASLILPDSYCADVFGGSRTFAANVQNRTGGGIRYSSLENAVKAFKYTSDFDIEPSIKFDETENVYTTVNARLFTGSSDFFRPANKTDGLYFALALTDKTLDVKSTFKISYNDKDGFITDLAGNRLKSVTFSTIDRMPPSISVVLSPINQKDFYVVFLKKVALKGMKLCDNDGTKIDVSESLLDLLPQCFEFVQINGDGTYSKKLDLQIDTNIAAQEVNILNKEEYSMFKMSFIREVSFDDVKNLHCRIKNPQKYDYLMCDPITNIKDSSVTLIQDELGNYINMYETHVLSDVAINGINPLYGYNSSIRGENVKEDSENLNYIVRDWNEEQKNYGTFKHNEEIAIVCDVDFNSIEKNQFEQNVQLFFNNDSENKYLAEKFNSEIGGNLRVWFPNIMEKPFSFFSLNKNTNFESVISTRIDKNDISKGIKFDILKESVQKWKSGDQISFLFSYLNKDNSQYQVYPAPVFDTKTDKYKLSESVKYPLFALRLKDKNDITSLDLWSFKVKSVTEQRGGVSILNNVINATYGEKTIVKLNVPQAGNVDVMVMTLDGNIVTYLQHGAISAGEHYFTWNGKNNAGQKVARGLYFVRVIGPNLDETRKVMVVKD